MYWGKEQTRDFTLILFSHLLKKGKSIYIIISIHNNWLLGISNLFLDSIECLPKQLRSLLGTFKNSTNSRNICKKSVRLCSFRFLPNVSTNQSILSPSIYTPSVRLSVHPFANRLYTPSKWGLDFYRPFLLYPVSTFFKEFHKYSLSN